MQIVFFANLKDIVGVKSIELSIIEETTLRSVLMEVFRLYPRLEEELLEDHGKLRGNIIINLNGRNLSLFEDGLENRVAANDRLMIFPAIGGGV